MIDTRPKLIETFRFVDEDDYEHERVPCTRFDLKVFRLSSKCNFPESFILPFFTRKNSIAIFSEGAYALSRSQNDKTFKLDLVTVFDAILTSRQTCEKLQCLYKNLISNNFRKTAVLKKISIVN